MSLLCTSRSHPQLMTLGTQRDSFPEDILLEGVREKAMSISDSRAGKKPRAGPNVVLPANHPTKRITSGKFVIDTSMSSLSLDDNQSVSFSGRFNSPDKSSVDSRPASKTDIEISEPENNDEPEQASPIVRLTRFDIIQDKDGKHVNYVLEVEEPVQSMGRTTVVKRTIKKRFSDFSRLRSLISKEVGQSENSMPSLPTKTLRRRFDRSFVITRMLELEFFLYDILAHPQYQKTQALRQFLQA